LQQVGQESQFWSGAPVAPAMTGASVAAVTDHKPHRSPAWRQRLGRSRLRTAGVIAAALVGAVVYTVMTNGGRNTRASDPVLPTFESAAAAIGFGLDQVAITGQKYTPDADIFAALDLANTRSFTTFDATAAKSRIEALPWIETAELVRGYPGRLDVKVTERKPWAVWHDGKRRVLVDHTGRVLAAVKGGAGGGLLRLTGDGAAAEAPALMAVLGRYPDIRRDLTEAERVAGRRWTLKLARDMTLVLPPEREAQALAMFATDRSVKALTAGGGFVVDLRALNKITVRKSGADRPATSAGATAPSARS
jgi:cell division protein FtsQ